MIDLPQKPLAGKKGFVLGIANEHSLLAREASTASAPIWP